MNEIFKTLIDKKLTGNNFIDLLIIIAIGILGFVLYLRVTKIDFNPEHFKKKKKLLELKEYNEASKNYNDFFKNKFIDNRKKELFFEIDTGISTHYQSINNYITLYNQLGKKFTWNTIKNAQSYLRINGNSLNIKISKFEVFFNSILEKIILIIFVLVLIIFFIFLFTFNKLDDYIQISLSLILIFSFIVTILFIYTQKNINNAISIQKRLDELTHTKDELNELKKILLINIADIKKTNTIKVFNSIIIDLINDPSFCEHLELTEIHSSTKDLSEPYNYATKIIDSDLNFEIIKTNTEYLIRNIDHVIEIRFNNKSVD